MVRPAYLVLGLMLLAQASVRGDEGEWSRFRGPNGSGISLATTVPVRWTEKDYNWKVAIPGVGHSSPVVWGRRIFVTCGDQAAKRTILCLDTSDGRTLWQREYPSKTYSQHRDSNYATATPAVDAEGVVCTWTTPEQVLVVALNLDGGEVWRRDLGPFVAVQGSGSSPILLGDLVVLSNDQEDTSLIPGHSTPAPVGKSFFIALDRKTGTTRWQVERRTTFSAYSTPCVYQSQNGRPELIFTNTEHGVSAVDPATGKVTWEFGRPFLDRAIGSPVAAPGLVIAGHGAGLVGSRYVAVRPGSPGKGEPPTLAFEVTKGIPLVPTPVVKNGRLFFWTDDGVVSCLRLASGEVVWRERVGGAYFASPICVNDRLYGVSKSGEVVVLNASDKYQLLARVPLGEPTFATPAVAGGVMYLRTRSKLLSLGGPAHRSEDAANGVKTLAASTAVKPYPNGRPTARYRLEAKDQGRVLRHGDGPDRCDALGARDVWVYEDGGTYYLHYDGAGPKGWLVCRATSTDLLHWAKQGAVLDLGKPGEDDSASASYGVTYRDERDWHMFYLGTPNTTPPPDRIPAFPYLTLKAKGSSPTGPWVKQKEVIPFRPKPGSYYSATASPGQIIRHNGEYLMFFSASTDAPIKRTLAIARTKDLNSPWTIDPQPIVPPDEQVENSSLYYEPSNQTWFLFTNHVGLEGIEYTDAIWVYWTKDLNRWNPRHKAVVLDGANCVWSSKCIGLPSVVRLKDRLAIVYDAPGGDSKSHMQRDVGLAWLPLPLVPPGAENESDN